MLRIAHATSRIASRLRVRRSENAAVMQHGLALWLALGGLLFLRSVCDGGSKDSAIVSPPRSSLPAARGEIDEFWERTLKRAKDEPLQANAEIVNEPLQYVKYKISYRSFGGIKIRAYLAKPYETEGKAPRRFPAIITAPGYRGDGWGLELSESLRGYVILHVCPRSQGESAEFWNIDGPDLLTWHIEEPEGYFYQGAYVDLIRGIDYLCSRPDVDVNRIGAMGISQGGGLVLAAAALDPRVKAVVARVPFLCDMRRAATIDKSLVKVLLDRYGALTPQNLRTLDFFDPVNLAHRVKVPTMLSAGGKDTTCPAQTIRAVFDELSGDKALALYPNLDHPSGSDSHATEASYQMGWEWMDKYLRRPQ